MKDLIAGHILYLLAGACLFKEAQFLRWIGVVTLWQILSIPQPFIQDCVQLIMTFGITEVGFNHKKVNDYFGLPKWNL